MLRKYRHQTMGKNVLKTTHSLLFPVREWAYEQSEQYGEWRKSNRCELISDWMSNISSQLFVNALHIPLDFFVLIIWLSTHQFHKLRIRKPSHRAHCIVQRRYGWRNRGEISWYGRTKGCKAALKTMFWKFPPFAKTLIRYWRFSAARKPLASSSDG